MKTIFKVVLPYSNNGDQGWISCMVSGSYALTYQIGKETKAVKNTLGVFVFKELDHVKAFMLREQGLINGEGLMGNWFEVLECEFKGRLKVIERLSFLEKIHIFYKFPHSESELLFTMPAPLGTYACKSITPILKVEL